MFTKYTLVAFLAVATTISASSDVFAGGKRPGTRYSRPIFSSYRCCVTAAPCAPATVAAPAPVAAADGTTYRSFSVEPAAPAPVYRAPAPRRTPTYLLPKMDPRKHSGGW